MKELIEALGAWGVPACIITIVFVIFIFMQITGEIIEWCGKVSPEILKIRKYFKRKREERKKRDEALAIIAQQGELLQNVQALLNSVNEHYSVDNITQRNNWMTEVNDTIQWVHDRAEHYDQSIERLSTEFTQATAALNVNTELTEEIFVQNSRDRIIDFAARAGDYELIISREEFNRIFKVYRRYEDFLEAHNRENGEIETNYEIILDGYDYRVRNHCFLEDVRSKLRAKKD